MARISVPKKEELECSDNELVKYLKAYSEVLLIGSYFNGQGELAELRDDAVTYKCSTAFKYRQLSDIELLRGNFEDNCIICFSKVFTLNKENLKLFLHGAKSIVSRLFTESDSFHYNIYSFLHKNRTLGEFYQKENVEEVFTFSQEKNHFWHIDISH